MHDVAVENVRDGEVGVEISAFVDGARSVPPEDVGVAGGFMAFLEAVFRPVSCRAQGNDRVACRPVRPR